MWCYSWFHYYYFLNSVFVVFKLKTKIKCFSSISYDHCWALVYSIIQLCRCSYFQHEKQKKWFFLLFLLKLKKKKSRWIIIIKERFLFALCLRTILCFVVLLFFFFYYYFVLLHFLSFTAWNSLYIRIGFGSWSLDSDNSVNSTTSTNYQFKCLGNGGRCKRSKNKKSKRMMKKNNMIKKLLCSKLLKVMASRHQSSPSLYYWIEQKIFNYHHSISKSYFS